MKNTVFNLILSCTFVVLLVFIGIFIIPSGVAPNINSTNYKNVTVHTQVNITNSRPEVLNIQIYDATNASLSNIAVNAGGLKSVVCNASVRDFNGFQDIIYVNATLYYFANKSSDFDDNNTHYTNSSCTLNASTGLYTGWYSCNFDNVAYYANNGTWYCNVTDVDTSATVGNLANTTTFLAVYALNITDGIDYGNLPVYGYSGNVTANITNFGNMPINVTVEGYGAVRNDGLAMNCSVGGNITVANERFATSNVDWPFKTPLNSSPKLLTNLTLIKQTNSTQLVNTTYWQLYADATNAPGGNCTGYIIFTAVAP